MGFSDLQSMSDRPEQVEAPWQESPGNPGNCRASAGNLPVVNSHPTCSLKWGEAGCGLHQVFPWHLVSAPEMTGWEPDTGDRSQLAWLSPGLQSSVPKGCPSSRGLAGSPSRQQLTRCLTACPRQKLKGGTWKMAGRASFFFLHNTCYWPNPDEHPSCLLTSGWKEIREEKEKWEELLAVAPQHCSLWSG